MSSFAGEGRGLLGLGPAQHGFARIGGTTGSSQSPEQQTFGYDREATDPFHLQINGKEYELLSAAAYS